MSSTKALSASALASVTCRPMSNVYGNVCEVRGVRGYWYPGSNTCFKAPRTRTPLAAIITSDGSNPEIRVYCIHIDDKDVPSIQQFTKAKDGASTVWKQGTDIPTKDLSSLSALAAVNYIDKNKKTQFRIYWQDTTHHIRQTTSDDGSTWKVSDTKISLKPAFHGTPIGAAAEVRVKNSTTGTGTKKQHCGAKAGQNFFWDKLPGTGDRENLLQDRDTRGDRDHPKWSKFYSTPCVIISWHNPSHHLVAVKVCDGQNPQSQFKDTQLYSASPTGTVTVLAWNAERTWIYYDGVDDGLQRVRLEAGEKEEAFSVFTGSITTAKAPGQGALTSKAFPTSNHTGFGDATIFYQIPGRVSIVEIRV
ncbi:hypothetical protein SISNIDRAFT_463527 [Sistotremastrum niveocremeum HHB9708]|uniref:Uncharacterized protein n=1 Tax=Sistotremastrum niveocremeum HHB9708 TaxID=1314777 RepID=A0A164YBN4_9AGAM|nr:hypothetical protein SISNIDRAFT_463527 [Sistotremastrum niveocremeum HHB9708]